MNMPMNFGQKIEEKSGDIIPKDTILWCILNIREIKNSRDTQGRYLDIELTVADGQPYARRKLWDKIADPFDSLNSEGWRTMAYGSIRRILEAVRGATPDNPNSYNLSRLEDLHGLAVPVLIGVEKGSAQYPDEKNRVEYISPHSSVKKIVEAWRLLSSGVHQYGKPAAPATGIPSQGSMFAGTASPPPASFVAPQSAAPAQQAGPGWLAPAGSAPAAMQTPQAPQFAAPAAAVGFQQGQAPAPIQQDQPAAMGTVNAAPPQPALTTTAPAAQNVGAFPSNQQPGQQPWQAPQQAGMPAQFPVSNTQTGQ